VPLAHAARDRSISATDADDRAQPRAASRPMAAPRALLFRGAVTNRILHLALRAPRLCRRGLAPVHRLAVRGAQVGRDGPAETGGGYADIPVQGDGHALIDESPDNLTEFLRHRCLAQMRIALHVDPSASLDGFRLGIIAECPTVTNALPVDIGWLPDRQNTVGGTRTRP
jgi:hypothetical protein